jgi:tetratricopeptide (TPR) repeat protein
LLLVIAPARAQQANTRETRARADCLAGRFQAGVDLLAQLFAESGNANYIYNQGRCYEQNGKQNEAILRFREYLRTAKNLSAGERGEVNGHIAECQAMKAEWESRALPAAAVPVTPPPPPTMPPPPAAPVAEVRPAPPTTITLAVAAAAPTPAVETAPGRPSADNRGAVLRMAGIVAGSIGAAALITGMIFSIETGSIADEVTADDKRNRYSRTKDDRGKLFADLQWVGYGVGAAALACGGALYYLGYRAAHSPASDSVSLLLMLLPGGTGAAVQGSF